MEIVFLFLLQILRNFYEFSFVSAAAADSVITIFWYC